jgi:hypothetical protein
VTDFFAEQNKNRDREDVEADAAVKYETTLVKHALARLHLMQRKNELYEAWARHHDVRRLTFAGLNHVFPTFPLLLGCNKLQGYKPIHKDRGAREASRFQRFNSVSFVKEFNEFHKQVVDEAGVRNVGMVFPRKGFRYGMIIYHDDHEKYFQNGLCWVYKAKNGTRTYVQPFTAVLDSIHANGRGWRPED